MRQPKKRKAGIEDLVSNLNDLRDLLDGPIGTAPLLKSKPLTPSQMDKLVKRAFNNILSHHRLLRLEISSRSVQIDGWKKRAADEVQAQLLGNPKVINPASIVYTRKALVLEQRLKVLDTMWELILGTYEDYFNCRYEPGGDTK